MPDNITLCLGHDVHTDKPNGCPHANTCVLHLALREREFPSDSTVTGAACSTMDYMLYLEVAA